VADSYTYLGHQELWYQAYLDDATGHMLIAVPGGGPYSMSPVENGLTVPPPDGRWAATVPPVPPVAVPAPVPVPQPAPAPEPAPEGGEV
jgi:hypothetical protein